MDIFPTHRVSHGILSFPIITLSNRYKYNKSSDMDWLKYVGFNRPVILTNSADDSTRVLGLALVKSRECL